jgi:hypothetical protein
MIHISLFSLRKIYISCHRRKYIYIFRDINAQHSELVANLWDIVAIFVTHGPSGIQELPVFLSYKVK